MYSAGSVIQIHAKKESALEGTQARIFLHMEGVFIDAPLLPFERNNERNSLVSPFQPRRREQGRDHDHSPCIASKKHVSCRSPTYVVVPLRAFGGGVSGVSWFGLSVGD